MLEPIAAALIVLAAGLAATPASSSCADAGDAARQALARFESLPRPDRIGRSVAEAVPDAAGVDARTAELLRRPLAILDPPRDGGIAPPGQVRPDQAPAWTDPEAIWSDYFALDAIRRAVVADIDAARADRLRALLPRLLARTSDGQDLETLDDGAVLVEVADALDRAALARLADALTARATGDRSDALRRLLSDRDAIETPEWLVLDAAGGLLHAARRGGRTMVIGGPGANVYTGDAAIVVDVGGDDTYALAPTDALRIVVDLGGNDVHHGRAGGAVLGASLLLDSAGDDVYSGAAVAQGAAVAGVAVLVDLGGNDRYHAAELAQGAALAGTATLVDAAGDDVYAATKFAQGFGGARGTGALIDRGGNDRYLAGARFPSSYRTPGRFQAFSQGVGMGFRGSVAGGAGLLIDHAGDDRYTAGNFAQGTGYFLGRGTLVDRAGDDHYVGSRYTQGAAAHLGVGLLRDEAGSDRYLGQVAASQGAAWDRSVAALVDCRGRDDYTANEFARGAAARNGAALFVDLAGDDAYSARRHANAHAGPDHDGDDDDPDNRDGDNRDGDTREQHDRVGSLGLFVDAGGDGGFNGSERIAPDPKETR